MNRIFLSSPHMGGGEKKYIQEAFENNWIAPLGSNVDGLERDLVNYNNIKGASVVNSGTSAIHLALRMYEVSSDDIVFCSTLTFVATTNPIIYQGAEPVFIDSEPETWNMSPEALRRAFEAYEAQGKLPKAVIVVNLYGQSAKMDEIKSLCEYYGVPLIEDAAESLGSEYKGKKSGTFGDIGIYSFNGNKIITTSGGGALVSNNLELVERSRFLATQARDKALHYQHSEVGFNYRMSNVVAGIGRGQMEVLDQRVNERRKVYKRYYEAFHEIEGFQFMPELEGTRSNRWLTALTVDKELAGVDSLTIIRNLEENNIEARPVWKPMHLQPVYETFGYYTHSVNWSVSDDLYQSGLCLPSGSNMTEEEQNKVIEIIRRAVYQAQ